MAVRLTQMNRKGTVCHWGTSRMATRFSATNTTQAMSTHDGRNGRDRGSRAIDAIPLSSHRHDRAGPQLRPKPAHVDVHHIRARLEVVAPYGGQEVLLRHGMPSPAHEFLQEEELSFGQRRR